jgi:hypothetical protein
LTENAMDCEKFESALMDELYGELDELTSAAAKRHVSGCARCAALLGGLRATRRVAALPRVEPPPYLEQRILDAAAAATVAAGEGPAGAGVPSSVTVISALAGARDDLPRSSSTLVPIITMKTAAMAVCGLIAQLPASDTIRATRHCSAVSPGP